MSGIGRTEPRRAYRVAISGSYGGLNLGDEAILEGIITELRRSVSVEITAFTRNPDDTLKRHRVERAVEVRDLTRDEGRAELERLDLFILGGGGLLYDRDAEKYLREVNLAHEVGVPTLVYAISAGPLDYASAREAVLTSLDKVTVLTVRDRRAERLLDEIGVNREVRVTADPALLLEAEPVPPDALEREGLDPARTLVGFSVREPGPAAPDIDVGHYHRLLADAADFVIERYGADVVFVPMERIQMDVQHSHAVVARMQLAQHATVLKAEYTPGQLVTFIRHCEFAVGMRLHFLILSALADVPFLALPYASKVAGFIERLQMEMPPLERVSAGRLIARVDHSWDEREEIRARIRRVLPDLQARARETNELAVQLLTRRAQSQGLG